MVNFGLEPNATPHTPISSSKPLALMLFPFINRAHSHKTKTGNQYPVFKKTAFHPIPENQELFPCFSFLIFIQKPLFEERERESVGGWILTPQYVAIRPHSVTWSWSPRASLFYPQFLYPFACFFFIPSFSFTFFLFLTSRWQIP